VSSHILLLGHRQTGAGALCLRSGGEALGQGRDHLVRRLPRMASEPGAEPLLSRKVCQSSLQNRSLPGSLTLSESLNLLQSRGGSLHLPLFQNGACPFPSTPLLSVLLLVTPTMRERVPMLPRLRIVAVSMQRLKVRHACMTASAIAMSDCHPLLVVEAQPTGGTAPPLRLEPHGPSRPAPGVPSLSRAPIAPSALIGTAGAPAFAMPGDGDLTVGGEVPGLRSRR
jgi:hypothetical protein